MTHKFGITPFPLTATRTSRLPRKRLNVEAPELSPAGTTAGPADPIQEQNIDNTEAEGGNH